jgi:hypothetical protein
MGFLMLSVDGPYSIMFNVEPLKILLVTVMEDFAVKCCNYYKNSKRPKNTMTKGP